MIGIVATIRVQPDKAEAFERIALELEAKVKSHEPGCVIYRMAKSRTEPHTYMSLEIFQDQAALDAHTAADYFLAAFGGFQACVSGEPTVEFLDTLS